MIHKTPYQTLERVFHSPKHRLVELVDKVNQLSAFNQCLHAILEPKFAKHCHVAALKGQELVVVTDSPAWATRIRYMAGSVLPQLRKAHPALKTVRVIRCMMVPKSEKKMTRPFPDAVLSPESIFHIEQTAEHLEDGPLKEALLRLAAKPLQTGVEGR